MVWPINLAVTQPTQNPLLQLASSINDEHHLAVRSSRDALQHAIKAGEQLLQARNEVGLKTWTAWMDENIGFSAVTAQRYMRVAKYKAEVQAAEAGSITDALEAVKGMPPTADANDLRRAPQAKVDEAKQLREAGLGVSQIASSLGVNKGTVARWTDPVAQARSNARYATGREEQRNHRLATKAASILPAITTPPATDEISKYRREGMADAAVVLVAKRIIPSMNLTDWGTALGLEYEELVGAVARFKSRAPSR